MRSENESLDPRGWWRRPLWVFGLLVVEYLYLALRFDGLMHRYAGPWANLADVVTFSVLGMTGVQVLAGRATVRAYRDELGSDMRFPRLTIPLSLHLLSYGGLVLWAGAMASEQWEPRMFPLSVALFILLSLLSLSCAALCVLGGRSIVRVLSRLKWSLALGFLGGVGAYFLGFLVSFLWKSLSETTIRLVAQTLMILGADVAVDYREDLLFVESFVVQVNRQCSGLEGMGMIALFLSLYLWVDRARLRFPRALIVLPLGILAMYLGNLGRIVLLVLVGARISPAIATGGFHSKAGWVYFCGLGILLMFCLSRSEFFLKKQSEEKVAQADLSDPVATFLLPLLTLLGTALVTGTLSSGTFDLFYGARVLAVALVVVRFRSRIWGLRRGMSLYGVASGILCFGVWMWLAPAPTEAQNRETLLSLNQLTTWGKWSWLATRVLGAVLIVPLAEELAFRGFLLRRFVSVEFDKVPQDQVTWLGLLASSLVFGVMHSAFLGATVVGAVYALTMWRRGAIADAILAHCVTNALLSGYVIWTGHFGYW